MEAAVQRFTTEKINASRAFGELNHPDSCEINPDRICHRITSLTLDNNNWIGESIILEGTPKGDITKSIIIHGGKPGVSTRGLGNINNDVVTEYNLVTIDVVLNPSAPGAFVNGILESKKYMIDSYGDPVEIAYQQLEQKLDNQPNHEKNIFIENAIRNFINSLVIKEIR
jgi:hypothetical protein